MMKTHSNGIVNPFSESFMPLWELWLEYKKIEFRFEYKSPMSEQGAINYLVDISDGDEATAIRIINQSIANRWKGLWELKTKKINPNGAKSEKQPASQTATRQSLNDLYNQRFGQGK